MDEPNNTFFNQLKKQIINPNNLAKEENKAYKKEQEIMATLENTKELDKGTDAKKLNSGQNDKTNLSAFEKLQKIRINSEETNTKTIEWIDNKFSQKKEEENKPKILQVEEEKLIETKRDLEYYKESTNNEHSSTIDEAFFEPRRDSSDIEWLKREIIESPIDSDFEKEEETKINENKEKEIEFVSSPKWNVKQEPLNSEETQKFKTAIDNLFETLEKYKTAEIKSLASINNISEEEAEQIFKLFEEQDIVELNYPTSLSKGPTVTLKNELKTNIAEKPDGKTLDSYALIIDKVPANISIVLSSQENRPTYCIDLPSIGKYTKKFLDYIKNEIAENTVIELEEILDPKKSQNLKDRFFTESKSHLLKYFSKANEETIGMLSGVVLHEMYGLGDIEILVGDDMLEEIAINSSKTPIAVYHRIHGWMKTNLLAGTEEDITNFASQIGRKVGREITTLSPILDAHLLSGDRVNATLFPISAEGNTLTIRRFARRPWTLVDFIGKSHTMNSEMAALLWLAMQYEMNILIAGGTASGKTSALNTLLALVPSYHRVVSIEDVREIVLPKYLGWNWIPMVTRSPNPEGLGEVTMLDLMVSSLRMRPDRIIVGEIRRKKEAEVLMEAIETGHSIYSTIHANSGYQVLRRLAEPPMSIPLMQIELIDLIVVQFRDRKTNKRRTFEIAEIEQTSTGKGLQVNTIYKWVPRNDTWEKLNKPNKILNLLNLHTGLTEDEILSELSDRENILNWMKNNEMNDVDMIGFIVKTFYANSAKIKQMAKQNAKIEEVQKLMKESKDN